MNLTARTIFAYQFGNVEAIRELARNKAAFPTGIILVLLTAVARNYDQAFILETPLWLFGPLLFSFITGSFIFAIIYSGFMVRHQPHAEPGVREDMELPHPKWYHFVPWRGYTPIPGSQWRSFMGLFWMTAPIAWLYAIPVERFLDFEGSARANLVLLTLVALWRVLLLARIISVVQGIHFVRSLGWVLLPASIEVLALSSMGMFFGTIITMGGMQNAAPEHRLWYTAAEIALWGAIIIALVTVIFLNVYKCRQPVMPYPTPGPGQISWSPLVIMTLAWSAVAVVPQQELERNHTFEKLIHNRDYRGALDYLMQYQPTDFSPSRRIPPDPYQPGINHRQMFFRDFPQIFRLLDIATPEWIRQRYLDYFEFVLTRHRHYHFGLDNTLAIFKALETLPEGKDWVRRNCSQLKSSELFTNWIKNPPTTDEGHALTAILQRLGIVAEADANVLPGAAQSHAPQVAHVGATQAAASEPLARPLGSSDSIERRQAATMYHNSGMAKQAAGDLDGAIADYTRALEIAPENLGAHFNRGIVYFIKRNWTAALTEFRRGCELDQRSHDYPRYFIWLIRVRLGEQEAADKELAAYMDHRRVGAAADWSTNIAGFLLARRSETEFLAAAASPDAQKERGQLCEAWFFAGMKRLLARDQATAANYFQKCLATGENSFVEYQFAAAELKAMGQ